MWYESFFYVLQYRHILCSRKNTEKQNIQKKHRISKGYGNRKITVIRFEFVSHSNNIKEICGCLRSCSAVTWGCSATLACSQKLFAVVTGGRYVRWNTCLWSLLLPAGCTVYGQGSTVWDLWRCRSGERCWLELPSNLRCDWRGRKYS